MEFQDVLILDRMVPFDHLAVVSAVAAIQARKRSRSAKSLWTWRAVSRTVVHGWCPPDSSVYNEAQAEKAWSRPLALYGKALA